MPGATTQDRHRHNARQPANKHGGHDNRQTTDKHGGAEASKTAIVRIKAVPAAFLSLFCTECN